MPQFEIESTNDGVNVSLKTSNGIRFLRWFPTRLSATLYVSQRDPKSFDLPEDLEVLEAKSIRYRAEGSLQISLTRGGKFAIFSGFGEIISIQQHITEEDIRKYMEFTFQNKPSEELSNLDEDL